MKKVVIVVLFATSFITFVQGFMPTKMTSDRVVQTQLDNGLTVLVCPVQDAATVSVQLWYNVGSKHEKDGERGIAHFIEHMIFKGTDMISESDIDLVAQKLSGNCNAFTWYDYTGYLFNVPVANWDKVLPMMADCMQNCNFDQEHLNSELKAVIQELKMNKDNYARSLREVMITNIFEGHPYHYSTIGFKQDLWTVSRATLQNFYKKYYTPDNAVMVVVGNVEPCDVQQKVQTAFGQIPAGNGWNRQSFYHNEDLKSKRISLYRPVQQSQSNLAYMVPGVIDQQEFQLEVFTNILTQGKSSRLHRLLVDDLQLVTDVEAFVYDMFEKGMLFIAFSPKNEKDINDITNLIQQEIDLIARDGVTLQEVERARRFVQLEFEQTLENTQQQAYAIGKYFIALQDANALFRYGNISSAQLVHDITNIAKTYCSSIIRHQGDVLAIPDAHVHLLNKLQQESDEQDTLFLNAKIRTTPVQGGKYVHTVELNDKKTFDVKVPQQATLDNGMELVWFENQHVDTIEMQLHFIAESFYDQDDKLGLGQIVSLMLQEGTKNYPGPAFTNEIESYGIALHVAPGAVSMTLLKEDFKKGLELVAEMLTSPLFEESSLSKIKEQMSAHLKQYWDTPTAFNQQLARQTVYKNHPLSKFSCGTQQTIENISLQDCIEYHASMISAQGARCAIVGNIAGYDVASLVEQTLGQWQGQKVEKMVYPSLEQVEKQEIISPINRDQIVLAFTGLSIDRLHEDFDKILLFDQIFAGSVMSSMSTRLFQLRQRSGLFYTIGGSLLYGASEQPGMIFIKTIVSPDRAQEAQQAILNVIDTAIDSLNEDELQQAKRILINSFDKLYETNGKKASTFLFLKKYNLPYNYFEQRAQDLQTISVQEVQDAVRKILSTDKLAVIKIGRV